MQVKNQDPRKLQYILGQQKRRRTTFNFFTIKIFLINVLVVGTNRDHARHLQS